jgi:hypothetical protein
MYIKVHNSYRTVVALCDKELIGKKFEEGILQLDVRENFYKGEEVTSEQLAGLIAKHAREDATFNIVGKESIATAIKAGIISEEGVAKIAKIPYALKLL